MKLAQREIYTTMLASITQWHDLFSPKPLLHVAVCEGACNQFKHCNYINFNLATKNHTGDLWQKVKFWHTCTSVKTTFVGNQPYKSEGKKEKKNAKNVYLTLIK